MCSTNFDKRMFSAVTIDYFVTIYRTRRAYRVVSASIPSRWMIEAAKIWNEPNNKSHWDLELDPGR